MVWKIITGGDILKKQYSKPGIIIEDFKISQHIASCGAPHESQWGSPLSGSPASCAWLDPFNDRIFTSTSVGLGGNPCSDLQYKEENGKFDIYCYNNPEGGLAVFGS